MVVIVLVCICVHVLVGIAFFLLFFLCVCFRSFLAQTEGHQAGLLAGRAAV